MKSRTLPSIQPVAANLKLIALLSIAVAWCGCLIIFRTLWTRNSDYTFLVWNLGLAAAPFFFSTITVWQTRLLLRFFFGFLWLLFLPNAPYLITDFFHLRILTSGPIWLDVLMLASCSATGLAFAYCSVLQIHRLFHSAGKPILGWSVAIVGLFLCGFGIYLGRYLRWRSIDLFHDPARLLIDILERLTNPFIHYRAWGVTIAFGCALSLGYIILNLRAERNSQP
ncbi:MAG: DUF1361 domain-containing protein [Limisphaerales bacterium]